MSFFAAGRNSERVSYLFVDGAYLRGLLQRFEDTVYEGMPAPVNYQRMAGSHTKVFYYDCPPAKRQGETDAEFNGRERLQEGLYRVLRSHRGWHIYEGVVKRTGKRARQKEVDILIAVDMLTHAYRKNMSSVTFLAGDQDFRPLIDALVRDGMFVELMYDTASVSSDLTTAADLRTPLSPYHIFEWLEDNFKKIYPLPLRSGQSPKKAFPSAPIAIGQMDWCMAEMYREGDQYTIVHEYEDNPEMFLHMTHGDLRLLKVVHAETYGRCEWRET